LTARDIIRVKVTKDFAFWISKFDKWLDSFGGYDILINGWERKEFGKTPVTSIRENRETKYPTKAYTALPPRG
jgi:hypothetical protein